MNIKLIPEISECVEIGTISRPHGKDGEVLISTKNIEPTEFQDFDYVFLCLQERLVPFFIKTVYTKSNSVFIQFEDIQTMEKAEAYCGTKIFIQQDDVIDEEDDFTELEGFTIIDFSTKQTIGVVQEVIAYSINIVLDIKRPDNSSVLIPFADELLKEYNEENKTLLLEIPDGILDA